MLPSKSNTEKGGIYARKNELRYLPETYLNENVTREIGMFNPEMVSDLVKRYFEGSDYLYNRIWIMIILHKWYLKSF